MHLLECDDPTKPPRDPLNPILPGEPSGPPDHRNTRVWCRYCDVYHYHSVEEIGTRTHRQSHCWVGDSLYLIAGYEIVVLPEGAVPEPTPDQRRKPRYVDTRILHGWKGELSVDWRGVHDRTGHYRSMMGITADWPEPAPVQTDVDAASETRRKDETMTRCHECTKIVTRHAIRCEQTGLSVAFCDTDCALRFAVKASTLAQSSLTLAQLVIRETLDRAYLAELRDQYLASEMADR